MTLGSRPFVVRWGAVCALCGKTIDVGDRAVYAWTGRAREIIHARHGEAPKLPREGGE